MPLEVQSIARVFLYLAVLLALRGSPSIGAQSSVVPIDASRPFREPTAARYDIEFAQSPSGQLIGVNSRYLTLDGKPWLPVMGEFHFSRYPALRWEEEILKMKAAGVNIIATYVIWIHHEEIEGQFDWTGQRDLRAFAQLCARHHMYMIARIGPWAHGEVRSGGFPDWVVKRGNTRENDPFYLQSVTTWYGQIGRQLNGLMWKDGGPVIGIQLENEYSSRGPLAGEAHILELKKLARASGFDVPLYFVTGWDNAVVPDRAVLPVYDGYPDAPWDGSLDPWPAAEVYDFHLRSRVAANLPADSTAQQPVPFLTAEMGTGIEDTYHRRPVIQPDDVAAILPVMVGSGVNLYGTYMFQGGENPDGKLTTLQESQATGYPNDVPVKSYDFQAPLGEFGEERPSFRKLKVFQYFLNDFGEDLAPMTVTAPVKRPSSPGDLIPIRATVRSHGDRGFLFVNNYVRNASMPARPASQFEIHLPSSTLRIPHRPVDIPAGAYFIWPFNLSVDGITLRYATAQLFTRIVEAGVTTLYFEAQPNIPVEFSIDAANGRLERTTSGTVTQNDGTIYISDVQPARSSAIDLVSDKGSKLHLVVLSPSDAENAWKIRTAGGERLLISAQDFFFDDATSRITLRSRQAREFTFSVMPPFNSAPLASLPLRQIDASTFTALAPPADWALKYRPTLPAGQAPKVKVAPIAQGRQHGVAQAPAGPEFQFAGKWAVTVPPGSMRGLSELFLTVRYTGDVARLYDSGQLLTDNFYNGQPWRVGLTRFIDLSHPNQLDLDILPLRSDAPVYVEAPYRPAASSGGQTIQVTDIELVPEYQLMIDANLP
jgi:hypothetical protein